MHNFSVIFFVFIVPSEFYIIELTYDLSYKQLIAEAHLVFKAVKKTK